MIVFCNSTAVKSVVSFSDHGFNGSTNQYSFASLITSSRVVSTSQMLFPVDLLYNLHSFLNPGFVIFSIFSLFLIFGINIPSFSIATNL